MGYGSRRRTDSGPLRILWLLISHGTVGALGVALGIYLLPVLTAPPAPTDAELAGVMSAGSYQGTFRRDLPGSDFLHWGEGTVSVGPQQIAHQGRLAPGPDYRIYLTRGFVETGAAFLAVKDTARQIGDVRSFSGFVVDVPETVSVEDYDTVVIWCETFAKFITAARYREG